MALYRNIWERFLLYLPMVVMGVLALGTYWLVRTSPTDNAPTIERPAGHEPDYFMQSFTVKTFDAKGHIRSEVRGDQARHYSDTLWMEIDGIHIRSFDAKGRLTTATAKRGLTNEDNSEVQLLGNAVVVREADAGAGAKANPRMEYRGEFLHAFMNTEKIKSHKPVELLRGNDRFTADTLDFDNIDQVLELHGRVRGILVPGAK
jgi:lipopolysaccharide export system protein LptC